MSNEGDNMLEFLKEYWKLIAAGLLVVISTVSSTVVIVKKSGGKVSYWDALKSVLLEKIPSWISIVEKEGSGEEKKNAVLNLALNEASDLFGRELTPEERELILSLAGKQIELILAAPQKKEVVNKEAKVSPYRIQK